VTRQFPFFSTQLLCYLQIYFSYPKPVRNTHTHTHMAKIVLSYIQWFDIVWLDRSYQKAAVTKHTVV